MALTEKQGGSDVRTNTTKAYCDNADEKRYILIGHKYDERLNLISFLYYLLDGSVPHQ
jgi:hypothetical protein